MHFIAQSVYSKCIIWRASISLQIKDIMWLESWSPAVCHALCAAAVRLSCGTVSSYACPLRSMTGAVCLMVLSDLVVDVCVCMCVSAHYRKQRPWRLRLSSLRTWNSSSWSRRAVWRRSVRLFPSSSWRRKCSIKAVWRKERYALLLFLVHRIDPACPCSYDAKNTAMPCNLNLNISLY